MTAAGMQPSAEDRYARQIRFAPIGSDGQRRLADSSAVIVGLGALGSVIAQHLVRSGVGRLRLIDRDIVEWSNLQRQTLYNEEDVRRTMPKAEAAAAHLRAVNRAVAIEPVSADLSAANAEELLGGYPLILDGTDNMTVRYLINEYSVKNGIPWIYGGAVGSGGMTMTFVPGETPCLRCLFPELPAAGDLDTCETAGVFSPVVDIVGSLQAAEALKWLSGNRQAMRKELVQVDVWTNGWMPLAANTGKRGDCPTCALRRFEMLEGGGVHASTRLCGKQTVQIIPPGRPQLSLDGLAARLALAGPVERNPYLVKLRVRETLTFILFPDGRALIQGTDDPAVARSVYAELLGV
ncbi:ThiF family adenylyltransferase [Paenibacillus cisolokensis]|uniref:ThiF family adenylyltransferase n=1 Tax=Paenibacillus cisolokensis TaxID=1658519 RepID=UPI003D274CA0